MQMGRIDTRLSYWPASGSLLGMKSNMHLHTTWPLSGRGALLRPRLLLLSCCEVLQSEPSTDYAWHAELQLRHKTLHFGNCAAC